jgi:hypothetical protein
MNMEKEVPYDILAVETSIFIKYAPPVTITL